MRSGLRMNAKLELQKVIDGGYCIGCGACAAFDTSIKMGFDDTLRLKADIRGECTIDQRAAKVCPFVDGNPSEDDFAVELFGDEDIKNDSRIGRHLKTYGGWVLEGAYRKRGSSGGIGSWLQCELLDKGLVDAVLNVTETAGHESKSLLFRFTVARTKEEVIANAKTRYYPVEMSEILRYVMSNPGRYAIIGVPCFCKAVRLASKQSSLLGERIRFVIGIVCGHFKSGAFADAIAWQCGVHPDDLSGIDFRSKLSGKKASQYGVTVKEFKEGAVIETTRAMEGLLGANWGHGFFKYKACDFCDDVLAETADVVVGDAWLPAYDDDYRGSNVVVVRTKKMLQLLEAGANEGRLHLDSLTKDQVAESQAGGLRHRREGLAYRLKLMDSSGCWRPTKRVKASSVQFGIVLRRLHRLRMELSEKSHTAFLQARQSNKLEMFIGIMKPLIDAYDRSMKPSVVLRVSDRCYRSLLKITRSLKERLFSIRS